MEKEQERTQSRQPACQREKGRGGRLGAAAPNVGLSKDRPSLQRNNRAQSRRASATCDMDVATDEVRKASWSHASNSPMSSEGRSPNGSTDGEDATTALAKAMAEMLGWDCSAKRYPTPPKTKPFIARAAAKAMSLEERVFVFFMTISVGEMLPSMRES